MSSCFEKMQLPFCCGMVIDCRDGLGDSNFVYCRGCGTVRYKKERKKK